MEQVGGVREGILAAADLWKYSSTWVLLVAGVVIVVIAVVSDGPRKRKMARLPPGPRNWPVIGAILEMEPTFIRTVDKFAKQYGPVVLFRLGVQTLVVVSSAEAAEELLKHRDAEFSDRVTALSRSATKYTGLDGKVIPFANYDAELKLHKRIFVKENLSFAKIKTYEKLRTQEMAVMVEKIFSVTHNDRRANDGEGRDTPSIAIRSTAMAMTQNILFSMCFGKRFDSLPRTDVRSEFPDMLDTLLNDLMKVNVVDLFPWLTWLDPQGLSKKMKNYSKRHRLWYDRMLESARQEIKQMRDSGTWNDVDEGSARPFVHTLLRAQEGGTNIADEGITALVDALLVAGVDSTVTQTEWTLLELVRHPKVLQKLQHELDGVVGKEQPLEEADLQSMPFLNAVILESLRLHGVSPFSLPHVNSKPSTLCGYSIPAKTAVLLNSYSIGRDPKVWKDPIQFNPDRFMAGGSPANPSTASSEPIKANGLCYNLLPFSSGRRMCSGYHLGLLLVSRTVGTLVHAFDWSPPPGCSPQNLSIDEKGDFLLHPTPAVYLVPTPRLSSQVYKSDITGVPLV